MMRHAVFQTVPEGFFNAVELLNQLPSDLLTELCHQVIAFLQCSKGLVSATQFLEKLHEANVHSCEQAVLGAINALTFLFRSAAREKVSADDLVKELKQSLVWSDTCQDIVKEVWIEKGQSLSSSEVVHRVLSVGQLVDMQWKLGVAMTSGICRSLNSTFVMMTLKIADPSGKVTTKSLEMTVAEFKNFSKQMREMAAMLEMI
ncbi:COMM domain-containing protein 6-like [Acanthaster planci]|uniref:COMM domain-containing protein 6 n=1 Tax=Acanthaster planci TaxID=133434 RepID=A0A8B7Y4U0_ACAPL|nr:COMM domain-containing protein 6-like [Acanthaster planci]